MHVHCIRCIRVARSYAASALATGMQWMFYYCVNCTITHDFTLQHLQCVENTKKQYHGHKSKLWFLGINIIRSHKLKKACLNDFQPPRMKSRYNLSDNLYSCGYFLVYCQGHGSQDNENCAVYLRCCKRKTNKATFTTL